VCRFYSKRLDQSRRLIAKKQDSEGSVSLLDIVYGGYAKIAKNGNIGEIETESSDDTGRTREVHNFTPCFHA
jgi:hypothetical protein